MFVTAFRPRVGGVGWRAGYGTGGGLAYAGQGAITAALTDADIATAVVRTLPAGTVCWLRVAS